MPRPIGWSEEEVEKLSLLYPSEASFEEIVRSFPRRTPQAIRLKASRLGLERPSIPEPVRGPSTILLCTERNGVSKGYLFRCGGCGSWIQVSDDESMGRVNLCGECGAPFHFAT